jgi:hypothetical protein
MQKHCLLAGVQRQPFQHCHIVLEVLVCVHDWVHDCIVWLFSAPVVGQQDM